VTIPSDISSRMGQPSMPLAAFEKAAGEGASVQIMQDGTQWRVLSQGSMPTSGRSVAWIEPEPGHVDTTSAFVEALRLSYSSGISQAVARELDLSPRPGQPLASRTVKTAMDMAETGLSALAGVDFFTQLQFSAAKGGAEFHRACQERGIDVDGLSPDVRQQIDREVAQRFAAASHHPVEFGQATVWLNDALSQFVK
jgi:hypothetical protein